MILPAPSYRAAGSLLCTLVASAAIFAASNAGQASREDVAVDDLNVVFIILDAAAARHFGCYGSGLTTSPKIDGFAAEATLFERAYSQAPTTLPSASSFLTGKYLAGESFQDSHRLRMAEKDTLAAVLKRAGLRTAAFTQNPFLTPLFGFGTGFDEFHEFLPNRVGTDWEFVDGAQTVAKIREWLASHSDERFFLYVHLLPPHAPYRRPTSVSDRIGEAPGSSLRGNAEELMQIEFGQLTATEADLAHLRLLYQDNIKYGDHLAGAIVDAIADRQLLEQSIVIVASDHGEAFGEHGHVSHGSTVYEEMIHVPLMIRFPRRFGRLPSRWPGVVELRQVFSTVCDALRIPAETSAESLLTVLRKGEDAVSGLARARTRDVNNVTVTTLVSDRHKLIVGDDSVELYDLQSDPTEKLNLAGKRPDVVAQLRPQLSPASEDSLAAAKTHVDQETRERLRILGYRDP